MASGHSTWLQRNVLYRIPKLYKVCPAGNYHPFSDRLCFCRVGEHGDGWHGGIYDFKTGLEMQYCDECKGPESQMTALEKIIRERNRVMQAIPACPVHGHQCVPHALDWIEHQKTQSDPSAGVAKIVDEDDIHVDPEPGF